MENVNKLLDNFYNTYKEENRFNKSNHNHLEFITTTNYIEKYLKKGDKILEVGAGTGAYSLHYAKKGYDVTAIELVEENIRKLKQGIEENMNIEVHQGNAVDLSIFKDDTFNMTLVLGPMYHLFTKEEQEKAIQEAIRVTKKEGYIYFAYITNDAVILRCLLMENKLLEYKDKEEFKEWIKYHLATCERKDLIGYSSHILHICQKK